MISEINDQCTEIIKLNPGTAHTATEQIQFTNIPYQYKTRLNVQITHDSTAHLSRCLPINSAGFTSNIQDVTYSTENCLQENICTVILSVGLPYFFGYKTEFFFFFQNKSKDLDPSYKTDLDLWDCLGRVKLVL